MVLQHVWGLFTNPKREWVAIRDDECTIGKCYAIHVLILAAIPAISGFIGTTQFGWQIGVGDPVKLTMQSAGLIAVLYYLAMLVGVFSMGYMIHWMGGTYGADVQLSQCRGAGGLHGDTAVSHWPDGALPGVVGQHGGGYPGAGLHGVPAVYAAYRS